MVSEKKEDASQSKNLLGRDLRNSNQLCPGSYVGSRKPSAINYYPLDNEAMNNTQLLKLHRLYIFKQVQCPIFMDAPHVAGLI